jgi:long-chain acyl-CoA synthetase
MGELEAKGAAAETPAAIAEYRRAAEAVRPDHLATLIYTSGTTGEPKGVMLTHDNIYSNVMAGAVQIPFSGDDRCLSFLPLSHIFERMAGHYLMMQTGTSIAYAESIDTVPIDMQLVKPTLVLSVPRLYEKMYARVLENALSGGAIKKQIFFWARSVADRWATQKLAGSMPGGLLGMQYRLAQRLVFSKLKARTGWRLRYFVSGGAPLAAEINKFFYAAGLVILEGYGLTETSPVITVNTPDAFRIGTVGKAVPGVEIMIASDGEICTRGPHVMKGYYNKPEATAEAIDEESWFHTGDIGAFDEAGYLRITDRKKELLVTSGGKKIAPQPIEEQLRAHALVGEAVLIGEGRRFPAALLVPDFRVLGAQLGVEPAAARARVQDPAVRQLFQPIVDAVNRTLAQFERVKQFTLLGADFSLEGGELTPTLKVKRRVIEEKYRGEIEEIYSRLKIED